VCDAAPGGARRGDCESDAHVRGGRASKNTRDASARERIRSPPRRRLLSSSRVGALVASVALDTFVAQRRRRPDPLRLPA
jgi:hypothetical protein